MIKIVKAEKIIQKKSGRPRVCHQLAGTPCWNWILALNPFLIGSY